MSFSSPEQPNPSKTYIVCLSIIPETPSGDTDGHDDVDNHLGKENKEEDKEAEGAVTPRRERKKKL